MRSLQEMVAEVTTHKYITVTGPVLDVAQELCRDGRIDELAEMLGTFFEMFPDKKWSIVEDLPPVILNEYYFRKCGFTSGTFLKWARDEEPKWSDSLKAAAQTPSRLPGVVQALLESYQEFAASA